jgi:hypothetical protein
LLSYVAKIQEAHPTDLWTEEANVRDGVLFASPRSHEERGETATACGRRLGIHMPAILDGMDNKTERAYTGRPDRSQRSVYRSLFDANSISCFSLLTGFAKI